MLANYDTCYLGPCWEMLTRADGSQALTKLYLYRVNRESRFAPTEEEALRIVARYQGVD